MFSVIMGRNVQYFCECFGGMQTMADEGIVSRAGMIQELVMFRDGLLCLFTDDFTHNDVLALIEHLCVD